MLGQGVGHIRFPQGTGQLAAQLMQTGIAPGDVLDGQHMLTQPPGKPGGHQGHDAEEAKPDLVVALGNLQAEAGLEEQHIHGECRERQHGEGRAQSQVDGGERHGCEIQQGHIGLG
jgi:hypothetical protein